jgi:prevent-host-death family protein
MKKSWKLQDAKAQFSKVVEEALTKGPQFVTRHGEEAVVVVAVEKYNELVSSKPSFTEFLMSFPKISNQKVFDRARDYPRDIKL